MKKIVISSNSSWNILNFRKSLIKELSSIYKVYIFIPKDKNTDLIKLKGYNIHHIYLKPKTKNLFSNFVSILSYLYLFIKIKPDFYLGYTVKPNIMGSIALLPFKTKVVINFTGLGSLFTDKKYKFLKVFYIQIIKIIRKKISYIILQNEYDYRYLRLNKIFIEKQLLIVRGSGIDCDYFTCQDSIYKKNKYKFLFLSRIKKEKGIDLFIEAIKYFNLKSSFKADFLIAGPFESNEIYLKKTIFDLESEFSNVKYLGNINDPKKILEKADVFVLPSIREGTSRTLLEAMSMKRLIIGSNKPGIKSLIKNDNGFIFKKYHYKSLYNCIVNIFSLSQYEIDKLTKNSRTLIKNNYRNKHINTVYKKLLESLN